MISPVWSFVTHTWKSPSDHPPSFQSFPCCFGASFMPAKHMFRVVGRSSENPIRFFRKVFFLRFRVVASPESDPIRFLRVLNETLSNFWEKFFLEVSSSWEKFRKSYHISTQKNIFHEPMETHTRKNILPYLYLMLWCQSMNRTDHIGWVPPCSP